MIAGAAAVAAAGGARAQATWPTRAVRMVVPFAPGASNDTFTRALADLLPARFNQPFVVENRAGAGGWTGTSFVQAAAPDGYTLLENSSGIASMGLIMKLPFDAAKDLTPIAMMARSPDAVLVHAALPVKSVREFVDYCKANPDKVFYGTAGVGGTNHLHAELFNMRAGVKMKHVPYRGLAQALTDLAAGRVQVCFGTIASAAGLIKSGEVRLLAYGAAGRPADAPEAPTVEESGVANYEAKVWWGIFGPPGLPADIRNRMNEATNAALKEASFARLFGTSGASAAPMSPDEFAKEVRREIDDVKEIVESAKIVFE
jgi:tripartite-type tricarboxylate transporter receptor subunit TctC